MAKTTHIIPGMPGIVEASDPIEAEPLQEPLQEPLNARPRTARLKPKGAFPIRHFNQGIVFYPGVPSAEIPIDVWLENQITHGTLIEI